MFFFISIFIASCSNRKKVDVSNINLDLKIERFDQSMKELDQTNLSVKAPQLQKQYGFFYNDYMREMLNVGDPSDTSYYKNLRVVLQQKDYKELSKTVDETFPDLNGVQNELNDAFKHILYYYPKQKVPRLISFLSGFTVQTPIGNDYIGIGLDMFLGSHSKFYPALIESIPAYVSRRFTPENITPRVMEAFTREELFPEKDNSTTLLDKMIYNGKIMYFMDQVMPDLSDSLKIGYTSKQLQWCKDYEGDIYGYFLDQNLLYESDYMKIQGYLTEAPFTPELGEKNESAPKLGVYIGWQIVKKYMQENPDITVQQLMQDSDSQQILNKSRYKPKNAV
ncbi:gliding motility lipoprotein GldB [Hufsiella arboris]|uniref:gliding motility lipoprotein GldB n=1 Tax=Hufsiella arboris TaxID=2695275 RepID=UPI001F26195C|nr:gliding motility lipoprotein GldB [Hufsiella arboris]